MRAPLLFGVVLALAASAAPAPARDESPQNVPTFGAAVSLVRISVVVRDKNGALVRGLKREDFTITEDDKPQAIEAFEVEEATTEAAAELAATPASAPLLKTSPSSVGTQLATAPGVSADLGGRRLLVLLFDANGMEPEQIERSVASARDYVETRMTASDMIAVASIGSGLQVLQDFTADRGLLKRALAKVSGADTASVDATTAVDAGDDTSTNDAFTPDTSELDLFNIDRRLRALEDLSKALTQIVQKKSVIYFSSGMSGVGSDNQVELRAAVDRAVKANLAIYPVDARGLEAAVPGGDARQASGSGSSVFSGRALTRQFDQQLASQDTLASLASDTGGRASLDSNDFAGVYERVVQDSSAYYVLGYSSGNPAKDGRFRRVKIRVNRPDLKVEYRSGYYADRDFVHASREDRERQLQDQLLSDLSSTDVPVWVQSAHFRTGPNRFYVPVSVAVPGSAITFAGNPPKASLELIGVVRDEAKRAVARLRDTLQVSGSDARSKNVQYRTGFTLPPGKYQMKVVVREDAGGAFGSFETQLVVPDLRASPVKVSSVVFGTQLTPAGRGDTPNPLARDGSELVPSVTHVVSTTQPLYFYYEVYDPARGANGEPRVLSNITFFRGNARRYETPLVEVKRLTAGDRGATVFQLSVPAASLKPGFYVCQVNVIDDVAGSFTFPRLALLVRQ